jgi:hypothetical protein
MEIEVKGKCVFVQATEAFKGSRWIVRVTSIVVGGKEPGTHL